MNKCSLAYETGGWTGTAVAAAMGFGAASVRAAESGTTTLYRAVQSAELDDIQATNMFRNLGSAEGKYFTTSAEAASSYAKQAVNAFGDSPYTLIQTRVPNRGDRGSSPVIYNNYV